MGGKERGLPQHKKEESAESVLLLSKLLKQKNKTKKTLCGRPGASLETEAGLGFFIIIIIIVIIIIIL